VISRDLLMAEADTLRAAHPQVRLGQALFYVGIKHDFEAVSRTLGTPADPFYDDSKVEAFLSFLETPL
jgi:hypothetical protein